MTKKMSEVAIHFNASAHQLKDIEFVGIEQTENNSGRNSVDQHLLIVPTDSIRDTNIGQQT